MNPQDKYPDITPEEAKASLGLATRLSEQMLMSQMGAQNPQPNQGNKQEVVDSDDMDIEAQDKKEKVMESEHESNVEEKMDKKMEILRDEMKATIKAEVESIWKNIQEAIENEPN